MLFRFPTIFACSILLCALKPRLSWSRKPVYNTGIADMLMIFDLVPWDENFKSSDVEDDGGLKAMLQELAKKLPINETHLRVAIMIGTDRYGQILQRRKFSEVTGSLTVSLPRLFDGSLNNREDVIENGKRGAFKETNGHRPQVPKIVIIVVIYPKKLSENEFRLKIARLTESMSQHVSIWMVAAGFATGDMAVVGRQNKHGEPSTMGRDVSRLISKWIMDELLRACPQQYEDSQCYFTARIECVTDRKYFPPSSSNVDPSLCFNGNLTWKCPSGEETCKENCVDDQVWSPCDCATNKQQIGPQSTGKYYEHCPVVKERECIATGCTTPAPATPPIYTLVMPVWAVFFVTFCAFLIAVVIQTVCIYFCCFPVGWEEAELTRRGLDPTGYRRPHQRFADSVVSFVHTFRVGRPQTARGGTEAYGPRTERRGQQRGRAPAPFSARTYTMPGRK